MPMLDQAVMCNCVVEQVRSMVAACCWQPTVCASMQTLLAMPAQPCVVPHWRFEPVWDQREVLDKYGWLPKVAHRPSLSYKLKMQRTLACLQHPSAYTLVMR
jgi:hypothetical protein